MSKIALVVDDTPANRDFLERLLVQAGFETTGASTGGEAMTFAKGLQSLALAVVDMQLPDINGLQLTYELRRRFPEVYIVVASMYDERSLMGRVFQKGGNCYMVKPHGFMELFKRITTMNLDELREGEHTIIDQFGPRRFKSAAGAS